MDEKTFTNKLKQLRGELKHRWNQFTPEDLEGIDGKPDNLVYLFENRYGFARRRAQQEVELFLQEFNDRLLKAA